MLEKVKECPTDVEKGTLTTKRVGEARNVTS